TLRYNAERFCDLQPGTIGIYRYDEAAESWVALSSTLGAANSEIYAATNTWGTFAVFGQYNAQPTFSDVPVGHTFYDYIEWMACRHVVSGYADGTFQPGNNTTRGQI